MFQADMSVWQGRDDSAEGALALRWHQQIQPFHGDAPSGHVLLGFPCDEGVRRNQGRIGAAAGPLVLRRALANLAWHQASPVYDAGDVPPHGQTLEEAQAQLAMAVAQLLHAGHRPVIMGGGHETAWGTFLGIRQFLPEGKLGIINLDAHFDLRSSAVAHSGTPFTQMADWSSQQGQPFHYFCLGIAEPANTIALFDNARQLGVRWKLDVELATWNIKAVLEELSAFLDQMDRVYLSIDLDVLPASVMPAVSAPAGRGVPLECLQCIMEHIILHGCCLAVDVVELNPVYDTHGLGAKTAATLIWQLTKPALKLGLTGG